ncbi:hypothetical protein [Paraburkholderia bannensis]|uniref:hypothetical protein n=1 Tax=Paraburkholderia bannensis TaxID=765414 RepID=UPI000482C7A3|nr:hypothetical protein [Paraburkholderia bannensis]
MARFAIALQLQFVITDLAFTIFLTALPTQERQPLLREMRVFGVREYLYISEGTIQVGNGPPA